MLTQTLNNFYFIRIFIYLCDINIIKLKASPWTKLLIINFEYISMQKGGVSKGFSLGPALANIIMTDLEDKIIKPFIADDTIKLHSRFVDETYY